MNMPRLRALAFALCAAAAASAAHAEDVGRKVLASYSLPAPAGDAIGPVGADAPRPVLDLTNRRLFIGAGYAQNAPAADPGASNKTAVDHRFESADAVGSLGYLCGLQPGPNETAGPASAYDPVGTFLGAQLNLAFR
jgi:hypothetical protein